MRAADAVWVTSLLLTVAACAVEVPKKEPPPGCENRGETLALGMSKQSPDGLMTSTLVALDPLPPLQGPNHWTVDVRTSSGAPVVDVDENDAEVIANIYMADHDHNLRKRATMTEPGLFEIPEFLITMNGYWEITVVVHQDQDPNDDADVPMMFGFCVEN